MNSNYFKEERDPVFWHQKSQKEPDSPRKCCTMSITEYRSHHRSDSYWIDVDSFKNILLRWPIIEIVRLICNCQHWDCDCHQHSLSFWCDSFFMIQQYIVVSIHRSIDHSIIRSFDHVTIVNRSFVQSSNSFAQFIRSIFQLFSDWLIDQ